LASFGLGQKNSQCSIPIADGAVDEANQTIVVTLSGTNVAKKTQMTVTIVDNDAAPTFSVDSYTDPGSLAGASEGGTIPFVVTKTGATELTSKVNYATANNTAVAPGDYTAKSGQLTFAPGDADEPVTVVSKTDAIDEPAQTFFVNLSAPVNGTVADGQGEGLITDLNDPTVTVAASDESASEGDGIMTFTISVLGVTEMPVSVAYDTDNFFTSTEGVGTCSPGDDYIGTSGLATIPVGSTSTTVDVEICDDDVAEFAGNLFFLDLSAPENAVLAVGSGGAGTITDDDDDDDDGVSNVDDNCPDTPNDAQVNTDGDEEGNACDLDDDNDGFTDDEEFLIPSNPQDACDPDPQAQPFCDADGDGLSNGQEVPIPAGYGTDPLDNDTDDDNTLDGEEVNFWGSDPLDFCDPFPIFLGCY
jgi:hypothetical protein